MTKPQGIPWYWFRTVDHPVANNRDMQPGERQWNLDFHADDGRYYRVHVGPEAREEMLKMLADDAAKQISVR